MLAFMERFRCLSCSGGGLSVLAWTERKSGNLTNVWTKGRIERKRGEPSLANTAFHFVLCSGVLKYIGLLLMWKLYHGLHSQLHNISVARLLLFTDKYYQECLLCMFFNPLMQSGSWRKRRSASSPWTMGKCSLGCSGKTIACLIQIYVIERSTVFGDVDTGSHNQCFSEALWLYGII